MKMENKTGKVKKKTYSGGAKQMTKNVNNFSKGAKNMPAHQTHSAGSKRHG